MSAAFELIVFDWDGTLADSTGPIVAGLQRAIAALGLPPRDDDAIRALIGLGFRDGLQLLYPDRDPARLEAELLAHRRGVVDGTHEEAPLYPGVPELLTALGQGGYRLAVATGKSRVGLDRALMHHRFADAAFIATRTADETAAKPHPRMLHELLEHTGVAPERALMVGDTDYDMVMAEAAGVPAIAVDGGAHSADRLRASPALTVLASIVELPGWLAASTHRRGA